MLSYEDFEKAGLPKEVPIGIESISIGSETRDCATTIMAQYTIEGRVILDLSSLFEAGNWAEAFNIHGNALSVRLATGQDIALIPTKTNFGEGLSVEAVPTSIPISVDKGKTAAKVSAFLISPPKLLNKPLTCPLLVPRS